VTSSESGVSVAQETSIVRYDGAQEEIVMRLGVRSDARDAAWLMPTPSRARVALGRQDWFERLDRLTVPRVVRHRRWLPDFGGRGNMAGAPAHGRDSVGVLQQQRLGPFEVTTLSADDEHALAGWLTGHGYRLKGRLAEALRPYVARHWTYTAIKLASESGTLNGELDPLRITFAVKDLVYPIRLSRLAKTPQSVHLYVLAPHRVTVTGLNMFTTYAGRVTPDQVGSNELLADGVFLTELVRQGIPPEDFTRDLSLGYVADTPYREVEVETGGLVTFAGIPAFLWFLAIPAVLVAMAVTVMVRRR
jgi:hypothetical protein